MANDTTRSPHIIDTTGTIVTANAASIKGVRWVGATTAGHKAVITDGTDRVVWASECPGGNYVESDRIERLAVGGYKVPTLDSGKLYVDIFKLEY